MTDAFFKMKGFGKFSRAIDRGVSHLANRQELAETLGEHLVSSTLERFENEKGPDGKDWAPSARAKNEGGQTLTDTAGLKSSINYEASPDLVAVGTNKIHGPIHQFGGEIRPKKARRLLFEVGGKKVSAKKVSMPARPYIGIDEDDIAEAKDIIARFIGEAIK